MESRAESGRNASSSSRDDKLMPEEPAPRKPKVKRKKRKPYPISLNLSNCKYEVIRMVQKKLGWKEVGDDDDWQVYWTDTSVSIERIMRLKRTQKINHFTGMLEICRKKSLAKNMLKMSKLFADEFKFIPKSFILPAEAPEFLAQFSSKKKKTFIIKPDGGCQGKGIVLVQAAEQAMKALEELVTENVVAQRYLAKPYLIEGRKFDMRIYVLVVSCDPLRIFIYDEGLARFATEVYQAPTEDNLDDVYMHLTNYALNKHNENFVFNESAEDGSDGSKWSLSGLREWMSAAGEDFEEAWRRIEDLTVKTLISIQPILQHNYRSVLPPENDGFSCFELLGLDVMFDNKLKPWLIEVNHSPSFTVDTPLDLAIKEELISDTIELVGIDPRVIKKLKAEERECSRNRLFGNSKGFEKVPPTDEELSTMREAVLKQREKYEDKHLGGYTRIYPPEDRELLAHYNALIEGAQKAFRESFPSKVRDTINRVKEERAKRLDRDEAPQCAPGAAMPPRPPPSQDTRSGSGLMKTPEPRSRRPPVPLQALPKEAEMATGRPNKLMSARELSRELEKAIERSKLDSGGSRNKSQEPLSPTRRSNVHGERIPPVSRRAASSSRMWPSNHRDSKSEDGHNASGDARRERRHSHNGDSPDTTEARAIKDGFEGGVAYTAISMGLTEVVRERRNSRSTSLPADSVRNSSEGVENDAQPAAPVDCEPQTVSGCKGQQQRPLRVSSANLPAKLSTQDMSHAADRGYGLLKRGSLDAYDPHAVSTLNQHSPEIHVHGSSYMHGLTGQPTNLAYRTVRPNAAEMVDALRTGARKDLAAPLIRHPRSRMESK
ncbi:hypothetical protein CYMTET_54723 [Cymbomonas tetramitiformis]|uniref:Uncharacterized protein n=1 Tax=Cymbomonas tetramitiformis TaxID=36881 RepID=A0AAE0BEK9_9CHLO|nr:hypothetical protein CYMTET_54723 [Cymbomonas tetramitiformis]